MLDNVGTCYLGFDLKELLSHIYVTTLTHFNQLKLEALLNSQTNNFREKLNFLSAKMKANFPIVNWIFVANKQLKKDLRIKKRKIAK